eukprot:scaffold4434_cov109-Isochrysis_galbana.AAC.5
MDPVPLESAFGTPGLCSECGELCGAVCGCSAAATACGCGACGACWRRYDQLPKVEARCYTSGSAGRAQQLAPRRTSCIPPARRRHRCCSAEPTCPRAHAHRDQYTRAWPSLRLSRGLAAGVLALCYPSHSSSRCLKCLRSSSSSPTGWGGAIVQTDAHPPAACRYVRRRCGADIDCRIGEYCHVRVTAQCASVKKARPRSPVQHQASATTTMSGSFVRPPTPPHTPRTARPPLNPPFATVALQVPGLHPSATLSCTLFSLQPLEYRCTDCARISATFDAGPALPLFTRYDVNHVCRAFPWYGDSRLNEATPEIPIKSDKHPSPAPPNSPPSARTPIVPAPTVPSPPRPPAPPAPPPSPPAPPPSPPSPPPPPVTPIMGAVADAADAARHVYALIGKAALTEARAKMEFNAGEAGGAGASVLARGEILVPEAGEGSQREIVQPGVKDGVTASASQARPRGETRQTAKIEHHRKGRWNSNHRGHNATTSAGAGEPASVSNVSPASLDNGPSSPGGATSASKATSTLEGEAPARKGRSLLLGSTDSGGNALNNLIQPATELLPPELASLKTDPKQVHAKPLLVIVSLRPRHY